MTGKKIFTFECLTGTIRFSRATNCKNAKCIRSIGQVRNNSANLRGGGAYRTSCFFILTDGRAVANFKRVTYTIFEAGIGRPTRSVRNRASYAIYF